MSRIQTEAISENMEQAKKHGNKLTQTINEDGELVEPTKETVEKKLGVNASMDEIKKELFEDNIVTGNTDHGLSELTKN